MASISPFETDSRGRPISCAEIVTSAGTRIYSLPVETFPKHLNNLFLIDHPSTPVLVDCGTPLGNAELDRRFGELQQKFGVRTTIADLRELVISHAHIDHFGNAHRFRAAGIPISIHELDARVLAGFVERLLVASRDMGIFMRQAGVRAEMVQKMLQLYRFEKTMFSDLEPDRRLKEGDRVGAGYPVLHVPGHCPGMICVAVDDVVLTADHVLARTTPTQSPQSITPFMGLQNYLRSLEKLRKFGDFDLALGAHEGPIDDLSARIDACLQHHSARLQQVHQCCSDEPKTVSGLSRELFGTQKSYGILLALMETGAHVEYLHHHGYLTIANIDAVSDQFDAAVLYRAAKPTPERFP